MHAMLELHIYGPAFGLPSIDVNCLAAIALLRSCLPADQELWSLIPSNDPSICPFNELPALRDDKLWIGGFRNIARYIAEHYASSHSLGSLSFDLTDTQNADLEAYLAHLSSRGLPLLDLSLYVSSDNYTNETRSTLSRLLSWPQSWHLPGTLRDRARARSDHLGLSGLDVDAVREKELKKENEGIAAVIPKSLRVPKKSVTGLLGSSAETTRFRLEGVTADFFEPLQERLGEKDYFLGDEFTLLDCAALAILGQMDVEGMPQSWLREALHKYPKLAEWTGQNKRKLFDASPSLPWRAPVQRSWFKVADDIVDLLAESMPLSLTSAPVRGQNPALDDVDSQALVTAQLERKQIFYAKASRNQRTVRDVLTATTTSAGLLSYLVYAGILTIAWPMKRVKPMRQGFGEAGALLGLS